jgi:hypothetical protein
MQTSDLIQEFEGLTRDFQGMIRQLRAERAVLMLTVQMIAIKDGGWSGEMARDALKRVGDWNTGILDHEGREMTRKERNA